VLFERFISKERGEPPDIDLDFGHQSREEYFQYIYRKYSRTRAALAAAVTTYRPRSAIRGCGKVLGIDPVIVDRVAKEHHWFDSSADLILRFVASGLDPETPIIHQWTTLAPHCSALRATCRSIRARGRKGGKALAGAAFLNLCSQRY